MSLAIRLRRSLRAGVGLSALSALLLLGMACSRAPQAEKTEAKSAPVAATGGAGVRPTLALQAAAEVTVTFAMPRGEVDMPTMGAVAFNAPMVALGAVDVPVAATQIQLTPQVPLRVQWMGTSTLGFWPTRPLAPATNYEVKLTGMATVAGKPVPDFSWRFQTALPHVVQSWPHSGESTVESAARIALLFDQPVDHAALQALAHLEAKSGPLPAVTVSAATEADRTWVMQRVGNSSLLPQSLENRLVVLKPTAPLPADTDIALVIAPGVRGTQGPLPSETAYRLDFHTLGPLAVIRAGCNDPCDPDDWAPVHISLNNRLADLKPDAPDPVAKLVTVTPAVPGLRVMCWGTDCSLSAPPVERPGRVTTSAWKAGQTYKVTLAPGLVDMWGQRMKEGKTFEFVMGHRRPSLEAATDGTVFELAEKPHNFGYDIRNVPRLTSRALRIPQAEIAQTLHHLVGHKVPTGQRPEPPHKFAYDADPGVAGSDAQDVDQRRLVQIDKLMGDKPGALLLEVTSPAEGNRPELQQRHLLAVTDLQVLAKLGAKSSIFWVTSLSTGKPVADASVAVVDPKGQQVWTGKTNADGLATGPGDLAPASAREEYWGRAPDSEDPAESAAPVMTVVAALGEDWTWLYLDGSLATGNDWGGGPDQREGTRGIVFMDKNVYKKGEVAHFKGIVRQMSSQGLALPKAGEKVALELRDPEDHVAASADATLSAQGSFDGSFVVPKTGSYGDWSVIARVHGARMTGSFEVLVYRTPKFKMDVNVDKRHYVVGDKVGGTVLASYYSGGPLDSAPVALDISGYASFFAPPGWEGFNFGSDLYDIAGTMSSWTQQVKASLDDKGRYAFSLATDKVPVRSSLPFDLEATATDPNGQPVADRTQAWLHPSLVHVGVRVVGEFVTVGDAFQIETISTDVEGKAMTGSHVDVQVVRRDFKQVRQAAVGGQLEWVTVPVEVPAGSCSLTSGNKVATCAVSPAAPGQYTVRVTATDSRGRPSRASTTAWAVGKGSVAWDRSADDSGILLADKQTYKVGDTARILVKNKVGGGVMLVTLERDGILETRPVALASDATTLVVPIEARHQPNFHVAVAIFAGRKGAAVTGQPDVGAPVLDSAAVPIVVDIVDRKLAVQVTPSQQRFRPQQEVQVAVDVRDAAGQPVSGEVTLWAVDEGVLALTGHQTPNPMEPLFAHAPRGVVGYATIEALIRGRLGEDKGEAGGGGGGSGARMRGDLRDVAVWLPSIPVDASGKATAKFTLPDNLTSFRIMAVASAGAAQFGSAQAQIQVDKPLMLLTTWPRQVHLGDEFEVALVARNRSGAPLQGTASIQVTNGSGRASISGEAQKPLQLSKDQSGEVAFAVRATAPGTFKIGVQVRATGPKDKDGKAIGEQDGIEEQVEVVDPAQLEAVATYDEAQTSVTQTLQKAAARPGIGGLEVSAAATGLIGLRGAVDFLLEYPYGCTEQLASQLYALMWLEQVGRNFDGLSDKDKKAHALAQEAVDQIVSRKVSGSGALGLWAGDETPHLEATAWGYKVLAEAKSLDLRVDERLLRDGAAWLRSQLASDSAAKKSQLGDEQRALVLATLAALGEPSVGAVETLFANRAGLSASGLLLLAEASLADPRGVARAQTIVADMTRELHVDAATAHVEDAHSWGWSSQVRTNAQLLSVMMKLGGDHPMAGRIARWLLDRRGSDRNGTTQENAWVLKAVGAWMQAREANRGEIGLQVSLADKKVGSTHLQPRALEPWKVFVPQDELAAGAQVLALDKDGGGTLYYTVRYTYALQADAEVAKNAGFFVKRVAMDEAGHVQPGEVQRGDNVIVTVLLLADRDRDDVAIVDQLPAGLEPVDFSLDTAPRAVQDSLQRVRDGLLGAQLAALPGAEQQNRAVEEAWSHRELAGREVRWFANHLESGVHILSYVARAAVRGDFQGRGARAQAMYRPDVFGTSGPNRLRVR